VPAGVTSIHVVAVGGRGGAGTGNGAPGGLGARVTTDVTVSPGQIVFVEVGGNGRTGPAAAAAKAASTAAANPSSKNPSARAVVEAAAPRTCG
jgi:hypothetical protein